MIRNIHTTARMILAAFGLALLGSACDNPTSGKTNGGTGAVTLPKFNQIRVDHRGNGGMTPAEVIAVMGFQGTRIDYFSSDFRSSLFIYFRESPSKYITVSFNINQRADSKELNGIQVMNLAKYQAIQIGADAGSSPIEVNAIMEFEGVKLRYSWPKNTTRYYWRAGSFHTVSIKFNADNKAIQKSLTGGFPGMITLGKYNRIVVVQNTGRVSRTGMSQSDIDRIMGFSGSYMGYNSATAISSYRWAESAEKYIEVKFANGNAISARASGLPGAVDKR